MTEKQQRILNTAAAIFAKYGYKKTTIDEIVASAGISKGLFYHYYSDKKELYLALYDSYVELMHQQTLADAGTLDSDFFERLKQISHIRIHFIQQYPDLWGFLYSAYYEQHPDIAPLILERNQTLLQNSSAGLAAEINWTKLREGISPEQALMLVTWIAEGFVRNLNSKGLTCDESLYLEFDSYLDTLKSGIYHS